MENSKNYQAFIFSKFTFCHLCCWGFDLHNTKRHFRIKKNLGHMEKLPKPETWNPVQSPVLFDASAKGFSSMAGQTLADFGVLLEFYIRIDSK